MRSEARDWVQETLGEAALGDRRRVDRLINIAQRVAKTPHGRISQVFRDTKEREGAYDFVENPGVDVKDLMAGVALSVRATEIHLRLHDKRRKTVKLQRVNALLVRESRTTPRAESPIQWILLTNHPIETEQQLAQVIEGYTYRWRIEDFHKAWKSGVCNVEETQLHKSASVMRWATILATVAVRAEQLKLLSRSSPDAPASELLSEDELGTLRLLRRKYGPRTEVQPQQLTAALVTRWIADLGGYTGKSSGGPPGSITIQRGLHYLLIATDARTLGVPDK